MFNGKSIFISGGTGSFGRNFIRRLLEQYQPKRGASNPHFLLLGQVVGLYTESSV
ncbi:hypothetical protein [Pseudomonas sp. NFIX28]|jgi:uncharacterized protein YbjT (DUF2867 family)|uniref:hypothetical protein n=1 Tax=Pseudomonas sp. NFIX28 TaxID=1566235 RepID=UPI000898D8E1|nr:hypothetical protein [Pseudomonas sp. NFIX28]SDZ35599.1 hypothetical protein SAMN03159453_03342 [Pseudomonas sp. NFIX28]